MLFIMKLNNYPYLVLTTYSRKSLVYEFNEGSSQPFILSQLFLSTFYSSW